METEYDNYTFAAIGIKKKEERNLFHQSLYASRLKTVNVFIY